MFLTGNKSVPTTKTLKSFTTQNDIQDKNPLTYATMGSDKAFPHMVRLPQEHWGQNHV